MSSRVLSPGSELTATKAGSLLDSLEALDDDWFETSDGGRSLPVVLSTDAGKTKFLLEANCNSGP